MEKNSRIPLENGNVPWSPCLSLLCHHTEPCPAIPSHGCAGKGSWELFFFFFLIVFHSQGQILLLVVLE